MENIVIIGSGPAGYTAAIYLGRAALNPILVTGLQVGGALTTTTVIENFPGFSDGIDGQLLMQNMQNQALRFGTKINNATVLDIIKLDNSLFKINLDDNTFIETKSIIIATGSTALTLNLPNKQKLMGYGLSTCATCDGYFYRNKKVAIIGGGDSAMEEANYLANLASEVYVIVRRDKLRASKIMQEKSLNNPKLKFIWNSEVIDTLSDNKGLTGIVIKNKNNEQMELKVDGLFMAIGHKPNTDFVKNLLNLDDSGYIITQNGTYTNIKGIFAAGDVEDHIYRQAITASARGCQAAIQVERYLTEL